MCGVDGVGGVFGVLWVRVKLVGGDWVLQGVLFGCALVGDFFGV